MGILRVAQELLGSKIDRLVVVTPTAHLKEQWAQDAEVFGLPLDINWGEHKGMESASYKGIALTYSQAARSGKPQVHRILCGRRRTLVIFDEMHHAGLELSWGEALRRGFEPAKARLALSGTPFRSDNRRIPFVSYDDAGKAIPDFSFTYGDGVAQGVCRPILFQSTNGRIEFMRRGSLISTSFDDDLDDLGESLRLRTALDPNNSWLRNVLKEANTALSRIREEEQTDAGGLVIARDQSHAIAIANILKEICGDPPSIAISTTPEEMPEASVQIAAFKRGKKPWIVAVRMVSEGVDIPRLRVGVYATNVVTEMFFRQAVGRFVRMQEGIEEQTSHLFIPDDDRIVEFALRVKEEREAALQRLYQELQDSFVPGDGSDFELPPLDYYSVSAEDMAGDWVFNQDKFSPDELESARQQCAKWGMMPSPTTILAIAESHREFISVPTAGSGVATAVIEKRPTHQRITTLRRLHSTQARQIAYILGVDHKVVFQNLQKRDGAWTKSLTEEQLLRRIEWLNEWKREVEEK